MDIRRQNMGQRFAAFFKGSEQKQVVILYGTPSGSTQHYTILMSPESMSSLTRDSQMKPTLYSSEVGNLLGLPVVVSDLLTPIRVKPRWMTMISTLGSRTTELWKSFMRRLGR